MCLLGGLPLGLRMVRSLCHDTLRLTMSHWVLCWLLGLLGWNWTFGLRDWSFLFCTSLVLSRYWFFRNLVIVPLLWAVTCCAGLALWRSVLLLIMLLFNIGKVECPSRLLVLTWFGLLISGTACLDLVYRLFSSAIGNWIGTRADELRPLWLISRFLTMTAVFDRLTSVVWINFTYDNFIIIISSWSFITFCSSFIFNLTPCPIFVCSTCCRICWLLSSMVLQH